MFTRGDEPLNQTYQNLVQTYFSVDVVKENFKNRLVALQNINNYMAIATHNRVKNFLLEDDLKDAEIILASSMFFKGKWTHPFDKANTSSQTFYNDFNKPIATVDMMFQEGPFAYVTMKEINSHIVELPYGEVCIIKSRFFKYVNHFFFRMKKCP